MVVDNVLKLFFLFEISCPETRKKKKIVARIGIGGPSLDTELVNLLEELEGVEEFELDHTSQTSNQV